MMDNTKSTTGGVREPLFHLVRKNAVSRWNSVYVTLISLAVALVICMGYVLAVGKGEIGIGDALKQMWQGTFGIIGNTKSMEIKVWDTALYAAKLLCVAVALAPAFKMHFWNIGAEGQIIAGGLVMGMFMHDHVEQMQNPAFYILAILLAVLAGAVWGLIPAIFKAVWGANETLFTLMMNYIAMKVMDSYYNEWKGGSASLAPFDKSTWLPVIGEHEELLNVAIFLILAVLMFFYLSKTKHGYEIAVVGDSPNTARYAGISVKKVILRTMMISGAVCGLCGALTVAGQTHSIALSGGAIHTVTGGYGFTAIIVAWLAGFNTLVMIPFALLILFLQKGTGQLANRYSAFATGADNVMIGIVLFCIIGGYFFLNYRIVFRKRRHAESKGGNE